MKHRGREHSSLTETATIVVEVLKCLEGVKMIAPGIIKPNKTSASQKFITVSYTPGGFELLISGQSSQKVAVHTASEPSPIIEALKAHKRLTAFVFKERIRKPGV